MAKFSETARERELFRYEASAIAGTVPCRLDAPLMPSLTETAPFLHDPILTALAQLCALRLEAACAYISFFETQSQHVVACASSTSSIFCATPDADLLDLCGKAFPRQSSISEHVLQLDDIMVEVDAPQPYRGQHLPVSHIPDLTEHPQFSQHTFVVGKNAMQWYAAVPIKSPRGANIGVISVYDKKMRPDARVLPENAARALREASCAITQHMELQRASDSLRRNERMVRGLGSFVEGSAGMSYSEKADNMASFEDTGAEGSLNIRQQFLRRRATDEELPTREFWKSTKAPESPTQNCYFAQRSRSLSIAGSPPPDNSSAHPIVPSITGPPTGSIITVGSEASDEDPLSGAKMIFSKAANVIRESLEVEGVLFLDASIGSFGGMVSSDDNVRSSRYATDKARYSSSSDSSADSLDERYMEETQKMCNVFGFSTSGHSSIDSDLVSSFHTRVPERLLSTLLRRYPRGRIFHFGVDGTISSGESEEEKLRNTDVEDFAAKTDGQDQAPVSPARRKTSSRPWSKRNEGKSVLKIIPEARSAIFVPLWDANKERWYAGGLIWTRVPSRLFTREGELSYLQAFGTTIMSEIMRSDALTAEKAKSDVLGSLSHELRSPLHGVLAAVDLFRDETLSAFQADLLHSLESCSRTLLDVVNHLLDYTKVNTYLKESRDTRHNERNGRPGPTAKQPVSAVPRSLSTVVHLDVLIEESVNSAFAGHAFQMLSIAQTGSQTNSNDADVVAMRQLDVMDAMESFGHQGKNTTDHASRLSKVQIFLQIDPRVQWAFCAQSGAIRRILLNLFGNSLKYTEHGFISVSMYQEIVQSKNKNPVTRLKLSVVDSGKGITPQFLQQKLFTPFAQEDRLAPGTGLGMSLVKQIVRTLSGSLTVESQVGVGTCVRVSIPLQNTSARPESDASFDAQRDALRGLRVSITGLSRPVDLHSKHHAIPGFTPPVPLDTMKAICSDWLQMEVVDLGNTDIRPDLILCGEEGLLDVTKGGSTSEKLTPTVVICSDAVTAHGFSIRTEQAATKRIVEYVSQPVGPRKLARALEVALTRWIEFAKSAPSQIDEVNTGPLTPSATDLPRWASTQPKTAELKINTNLDFSHQNGVTKPLEQIKEAPSGREEDSMIKQGASQASAVEVCEVASTISPGQIQERGSSLRSENGENGENGGVFSAPDTFLLVDDNKINLQILVSFMKKLQLPYRTASNGLEAYKRYAQEPWLYRCILMDLSMPIMDGLEACRRIREFERNYKLASTTVVALTGLASVETQRDAFASGMDMFYTKPVKLKDLSSAISEQKL